MSALAIIVTAAMVVPADLPEKGSREMTYSFYLSGEWEGIGLDENGQAYRRVFLDHLRFRYETDNVGGDFWTPFIFENGGKLRYRGCASILGIYRQEAERLYICYRQGSRPTTYRGGSGQTLLILHHVKPRK